MVKSILMSGQLAMLQRSKTHLYPQQLKVISILVSIILRRMPIIGRFCSCESESEVHGEETEQANQRPGALQAF
jgi:hypothetical protein